MNGFEMKLLNLPSYKEFAKVNKIALTHLLSIVSDDHRDIEYFSIKLQRKLGHSYEIVLVRKIYYHTKDEIVELKNVDINLRRVIRLISKRSKSANIIITIYKMGEVSITDILENP